MKIKNIEITKNFKKIIALVGTTLVLTPTLCACGNRSSIDKHKRPEFSPAAYPVSQYMSPIMDEDIEKIPEETKEISLTKCHYITDLSSIPTTCPDLEVLKIKNCPNITDLSFIYNMKNLRLLELNDIVGITPELIDYLNDNNIKCEIEEKDIIAAEKARQIISEIIKDDMTEQEKINAIILYVSKNTSYRLSKTEESNENPLEMTLNENKGVCEGIAYTTNVLLRLAGIESYLLENTLHAWNLICIDDEYYYIDVTNLGGGIIPKKIAGTLIDKFDFGTGGYMIDPDSTLLTFMSDYDSKKVVIPQELIDDIESGEEKRNIIEKYKNTVPGRIIELIIIVVVIKKIKKAKEFCQEKKELKKK